MMKPDDISPLRVLIVQSRTELGTVWRRHLERCGMQVAMAQSQDKATGLLAEKPFDIIVLDIVLDGGAALAIADFAHFRQPDARVIFVSSSSFFSDGSIFAHAANARAFLPAGTPPEDLAAMVEHCGAEAR